jgi:DNA-binding NtrC family response regulator
MDEPRHPGPLLVVDDLQEICLALQRILSLYIEEVYTAGTPAEAEAVLKERLPRLLLCDYWLGNEYPPGTALIPIWRKQYPGIERVALMTGTAAASLDGVTCVDAVFQKPLEIDPLVEFLVGKCAGAPD